MYNYLLQIFAVALAATLLMSTANGQSERASEGSALSVLGTSTLIEGSVEALAAGPSLVVESVHVVGDRLQLVVSHGAQSARTSFTMSVQSTGGVSLGVGHLITVTTSSAGVLLSSAGQLIAWLPNELGRQLSYEQDLGRH